VSRRIVESLKVIEVNEQHRYAADFLAQQMVQVVE
jgi:hypothetical protein